MRSEEEGGLLPKQTAEELLARGSGKAKSGDIRGAIADYTQAVSLKPGLYEVYYDLGFWKKVIGDLDGALADFTNAIALSPADDFFHGDSLLLRGMVKIALEDWDGAILDCTRSIELEKGQSSAYEAYCYRGMAKRGRGSYEEAGLDFEMAIKLNCHDTYDIMECSLNELYALIVTYKGKSLYKDILAFWARATAKTWLILNDIQMREGDPVPVLEDTELSELYELSRINDLLLLSFQPTRHGMPQPYISPLTVDEYGLFFEKLQFSIVTEKEFQSFYHEIVEVEQADDINHPIEITETLWPCLMLGDLMFSRAGVKVRGGSKHINKEAAEISELYWAHQRKNRAIMNISRESAGTRGI